MQTLNNNTSRSLTLHMNNNIKVTSKHIKISLSQNLLRIISKSKDKAPFLERVTSKRIN